MARHYRLLICIALLPSVLGSGCGLYTPMLEPGEDHYEQHVTGIMVNRIVDHVKCELGRAIIFEINQDIGLSNQNHKPRNLRWLETAAGTLTLTLAVDEKGTIAPEATWTDPLATVAKTAQSFGIGGSVTASSDATRKQQVDFVFDVQRDFLSNKNFMATNNFGTNQELCKETADKIAIDGNLRIAEWLDGSLYPHNIPNNAGSQAPDVLTDDIMFVVTFGGSITPSWKLVNWSINSGTFATATRIRTNEALISIGPSDKKGAKGISNAPTESVIQFRNIALIGSALNISNITIANHQ